MGKRKLSEGCLRITESEAEKIILWLKCLLAGTDWHICLHSQYLPVSWMDTCTSLAGQPLKWSFSKEATIKLIRFLLTKLQSHSHFTSLRLLPKPKTTLTGALGISNTWVLQLQITSWLSQLPNHFHCVRILPGLTLRGQLYSLHIKFLRLAASHCHSSVDC